MSALLEAPKSNGHKRPTKSPRPKSPPPLPATTSTTAPAGLEARYGDGPRLSPVLAASLAEERLVELRLIHPHPDNRELSDDDPDIQELAASIGGADGLLQAITVRVAPEHWDLPAGHYQIVDGERRWRASRAAGLKTVRVKVREDLDDAQTKALLAVANAQRKDLNAIEKARLIEQLCTTNADGSPPLTREQAAQKVGLETGAAASNLVRLLALPPVWQARVASGELPWTWAREILPVVKLEPVLEELDRDWGNRETDLWDNTFLSRKMLGERIDNIIDQHCRRLDQDHYVNGGRGKLKIDADDPAVREQLGIVEVELAGGKRGKTETVLVATDSTAFDTALEKQLGKKGKASAEKAGEDEPAPKRELTAAERKQKAQERGKLRSDRIASWRDKLLRRAIIDQLDRSEDDGLRLLLAYVPHYNSPAKLNDLIEEVQQTKPSHTHYREHLWNAVAGVTSREAKDRLTERLARELLVRESNDWRGPIVPHELIEAYATSLSIDVAGEWIKLQATAVADREANYALLEEFFMLHQTEELKELAAELGAHLLPSMSTRTKIVDYLLSIPQGTTRRLPLPKSIKPLAGVRGQESGASKKRKGK